MPTKLSGKEKKLLEQILARVKPELTGVVANEKELARLPTHVKEEVEDILIDAFSNNLGLTGEPNTEGVLMDDLLFSLQQVIWPERWQPHCAPNTLQPGDEDP